MKEIDELLSTEADVDLTLPRLALFYGPDWDSAGEGKCYEVAALVGGVLGAILDVPVPQDEHDVWGIYQGSKEGERAVYVSGSQLYTGIWSEECEYPGK